MSPEFDARAKQALNICSETLLTKNLDTKTGCLRAGNEIFTAFWARDLLYAMPSLMKSHPEIVEANLEMLLRFQKNGEIPLRVSDFNHSLNIFVCYLNKIGFHYELPKYPDLQGEFKSSRKDATDAIDPTALLIITAALYRKFPGGEDWWITHEKQLNDSGEWLLRLQDPETKLILEGPVSKWSDYTSDEKEFFSGYINILSCEAFRSLGWTIPAKEVLDGMNRYLWDNDKGYFCYGMNKKRQVRHIFAADVNLLAVTFGLTKPGQTESIMKYIENNNLDNIPVVTFDPAPKVPFLMKKLNNYDGSIFGWWGGVCAMAYEVAGNHEKAINSLNILFKLVNKHNRAFEAVKPDGGSNTSGKYPFEMNMSWTAGVILQASQQSGVTEAV